MVLVGVEVEVLSYLEMVVPVDKDLGKEIVAEKEVDLVVVYHDQVQVCLCQDVDCEVDHLAASDHLVHHCFPHVDLHLEQVVVDAYHYLDPLEYHYVDLPVDDHLVVVNLVDVVSSVHLECQDLPACCH